MEQPKHYGTMRERERESPAPCYDTHTHARAHARTHTHKRSFTRFMYARTHVHHTHTQRSKLYMCMSVQVCVLILSALQIQTDSYLCKQCRSWQESHQALHCLLFRFDFRLKLLFTWIEMSNFKHRRVHFRTSGVKGLKQGLQITKTCLYKFDPLKPHFYIVKLGFTGVYIIFLFSADT